MTVFSFLASVLIHEDRLMDFPCGDSHTNPITHVPILLWSISPMP